MKSHGFLKWGFLPLIIFTILSRSRALQPQPISNPLKIDQFINQISKWRKIQMSSTIRTTLAGFLCFVAATISSAGGIGGGGIFLPILNIVVGLDLKTASSFSAFMVTGGSVANVIYNLFGRKTLIDYDIALLSEPSMLLGVSVGVICHTVFPEWLITVLFATFLAWSTFKTCKAGVFYWKVESEEASKRGILESGNGLIGDEICYEKQDENKESMKEPLWGRDRCGKRETSVETPWKKLGFLLIIWLAFFALHVLRGEGNGDGNHRQSITGLKPCGIGYWILSAIQIPVAMVFTGWILYRKRSRVAGDRFFKQQEEKGEGQLDGSRSWSSLSFPTMALLAGVLGGGFGIGGGMLISPLLLQMGIPPEITAATCSFMVLFSSSMSAAQYLLMGIKHIDAVLIFTLVCFVASIVGLVVVQSAIVRYGRTSLIVFSVAIVMAVSTILITSFGAVDVWQSYMTGKYMGFKLPC
ncbi:sulfite exporter TauE/SafE family protein 5-like isoform X2 [Telopea speciosissima]|uniref:sulfite exporter TauE/SafE family protein 5-like isoform X1 n=1 Tax=Telopea speciosissima TaxID=54955 RepID=UPI001CC4C128|nr:sulfite exporter TauE/SafE family protein 5-like isoform X1 [Telopea speciosissima]XP_043688959.1 sulfite exporter TauE/SafE family protein 5-like isoform X2 [Telopea speciosissima]